MIAQTLLVSSVLLLSGSAYAQQSVWGQCGGKNWSGATTCASGSSCVEVNEWYFQCQPGSAPAPTTQIPSPTPSPTSTPTPSNGGGSTKTSSTSTIPEGTGTPTGPGTTLQSGYLWIRAVAAPNFHKYLQSSPLLSTGSAVLESYLTAGQFTVQSDGQLAQLVSGPGQAVQFLYANVGKEKIHANKTLRVTWSKDKGTYGKFAWQGDSLTWSTSDISRPNSAAWYVCGKQELFVNLGNYLSDTPSGCADQTIHYYNDSKANN